MIINGQEYGPRNALIIAELGTSPHGDIVKAREMIAAAAESGANCVKFQIVIADEILHPNTGEVSLPGGKIRLYDRFKQLELDPDFYAELKDNSESQGLLFLCTPFGRGSARILRELEPKIVKIASPELNYTDLLEEIAQWKLPVLFSSGVSSLGDIEKALGLLGKNDFNYKNDLSADTNAAEICLLHCVTAYPAPETDYNLRLLGNLSGIFGVPVGVSDHSMNPELVPVLALGQGAIVIEKHFCLSRSDSGLDDPIALPPALFTRMVQAVRRAQEAGPEQSLKEMTDLHGEHIVKGVLGSGIKTLAPSEKMNYLRTNRSIHALRDIKAGQTIKLDDFGVLRTEKNLRPGLPPHWASILPGRKARQFIPNGEGIRIDDI